MKIVMAEYSHYQGLYRLGGHHLADYLVASGHDVLYISAQVHPLQLYHLMKQSATWPEIRGGFMDWLRGGRRLAANLLTYTPLTLLPIWRSGPFATYFVAKNTLRATVPNLCKYIAHKGFGHPDVLMVAHPFLAGLFNQVEATATVYRINDDVTKFPSMPASMMRVEVEAITKAGAVVVTAMPLLEKVKHLRHNEIHYLPNGVDFKFYSSSDRALPDEYRNFSQPIVVYMGAVNSWFDQDLLRYCATQLPYCTFVIIGPVHIDVTSLRQTPNVCFLGRKPYDQLPRYLYTANVGIIPFQVTSLIQAVSPLKLFEYMACGLPVVATRWQELEQIHSPAYLAEDKEEFLANLKAAIGEDKAKAHLYQEFASRNSWQTRGRKLEDIFANVLQRQSKNIGL